MTLQNADYYCRIVDRRSEDKQPELDFVLVVDLTIATIERKILLSTISGLKQTLCAIHTYEITNSKLLVYIIEYLENLGFETDMIEDSALERGVLLRIKWD